jgi:ATP-dependent Clp protease ATP-binding subunit ClpC
MEIILAFVAGVVVALLVMRGRSQSAAPATVQTMPSQSPSVQLQNLTGQLDAVGEASAHPRDLADNAVFRQAVAIFAAQDVPIKLVTDYIGGANWMLSTAACAALCARADRGAALLALLAGFPNLRPWPMYFGLQYLNSLDERPPVGAPLLRWLEWSADNPFLHGLLAEHFTLRTERGDPPTFGDSLNRTVPADLTFTEGLLRRIDHPTSRALLDELAAHRRQTLDRGYLETFGRFIDRDPERPLLIEHDAVKDLLKQSEDSVLQLPARSLLVVGDPRTGKSSFLTLLSMRAEAQGWTILEASAAHLMAGQMYIGQLEERLHRLTTELAVEKRVLWRVPDFLQLATSGTHKGQSASVLDQVLPAIAAGRIVLISETTPAGWTKVLQERPALRAALEVVRLRPLAESEINALARQVADRLAASLEISVDPEAIEAATYLARHYLGTTQMPGAALDLLKLAAQRAAAHDSPRMRREDVLATMSQMTGMPPLVLDDRERVDLTALRQFFTSRVIGQDEAVDAVVDRIAMLKAGLTDPSKPVAVFLFAGPTGTGKTELAKTLAEFLFGSAERLIRLDMSEFQSVESLRKIVGDADGQEDTQALTHRVRKQPFSVVLLDEFEKAHANSWDLFLQVFDDGRLTDAGGHTVDFRHCIIILTSNLGSTIKQDAGLGFTSQTGAFSQDHVMRTINQSFRPEFVNRIDRVIVFRPLTRDHMRSIVSKELSRVLERRGLRDREWAVEWEASALEFLLDKGFSPAMGARPLKRAIDQHLLAPFAATLVEHRFPEGDQFLFVRSDGRTLQVEFVDPNAPAETASRAEPEAAVAESSITLARMMLQPAGIAAERAALSAELQRIEEGLTGDRWTLLESDLATRMQRQDFWKQPDRQGILSRFEVMDRVKAAAGTARGLAARLDRSSSPSGRFSKDLIARLASQLFVVRHGIEDAVSDAPVEVALCVQAVLDLAPNPVLSARWCDRLLEMYRAWVGRRGMHLEEVSASGSRRVFVISGFGAARLLKGEAGLHILDYEDTTDSGRAVARVRVAPTPAVLPESSPERHAALIVELEKGHTPAALVRRYRVDASPLIRDVRQGWRTGRAELVFAGHFDIIGDVWPAATESHAGARDSEA